MLAPMLGLNSFEIRNNTHTHTLNLRYKVQSTKTKIFMLNNLPRK